MRCRYQSAADGPGQGASSPWSLWQRKKTVHEFGSIPVYLDATWLVVTSAMSFPARSVTVVRTMLTLLPRFT